MIPPSPPLLLQILHQQWFWWVNGLLLFLFSGIFLLLRPPSTKNKLNRFPSPPRLPLIGHLHLLGSLAHRSLASLSAKHGHVMLLHFGRVPTVVVSSAAAAEEVMKDKDLAFASRPDSTLIDRLLYNSQDVAFSNYGDYWRQVRRVCVVHMLSLKKVQLFRPVKEEEVALLVERIRNASGRPVNLSKMIVTLTSDIICRVAFGKKYTSEVRSGERFPVLEFAELLGAFPVRDFIPWLGSIDWLSGLDAKVRKNSAEMDTFLEKVLVEHSGKERRKDEHEDVAVNFIDILLGLNDEDGRTAGISLSRDSVKALTLDMFSAGTDTTYTTIVWAMSELIKHPEEMKRVQEEVRKIAGPKGEVADEDIQRMEYLKAVIKEALRLHPPVPLLVPREAIEDTELQGYEVPRGTRVIINAWAIGRDARSWPEKAEEFWPERFLSSSVDFKGQDFEFIPFGAGRRGCPGAGFAMASVEIVLANLLYHFHWEMPNKMKVETLDMSETLGITLHKETSLLLVANPNNA